MSHQAPVIFNGRYELHRRLGRGGMAEVYLARDQMLDRPVAVKVLFPALATDPGFVERFRREAQSAAALNHPNIVSVYDWGEANGTYFIVMEYVEGESLAEMIHAQTRLHPDRAAEIGSDMASALGFAHRNGVVHRDVKPGNVLITRDGDVKVADFGIARAISDSSDQALTKTGSVMGTATYFSPEQARGANVDQRSDIYALGCVIYEMITGRPPFSGENAVAIAYKHVQEAVVPPRRIDPALPETLEAIILKCLAKNPANRYPTAQDLRADLRRYLDGARILAEPVQAAPPIGPDATGVMAPTGYVQPTSAQQWDDGYGDYGYDDDYQEEEEPKRSKAFLVMLILLLLVLAGLLFLVARALGGGGEEAEQIEVPRVVDMAQADAEQAIRDAGLEPRVEEAPHPTVAAGTVFETDPQAGREVDEGSTVVLRVSTGPETVNVPDLTNMTADEATSALNDLGLVPNRQEEENPDVEAGRVIRQDPAPNSPVAAGTQVTFVVSVEPQTTTVPGGLAGMTVDEATVRLQEAGLTVAGTQEEPSSDVEEGRVTRSDPGEGASVNRGGSVTLFVSSGPDEVEIPDVEGLSEENATRQLSDAGFTVVPSYEDVDDPNENGRVLSQSRTGSAPAGSEISIVVGQFNDTSITLPGGGGGGGGD
jgi:eukaryotic-like serine/threonine-protein kinase